jgi:hypothetical protein
MGGHAIRENLKFAKATIKKTNTTDQFVIAAITFLDASTSGSGRSLPDGLEVALR